MYQKVIFHCDCMYVILKNHRIKENICHSIPKGAHVQIFQLYQPFWKDWGGGVVQVSFLWKNCQIFDKVLPRKIYGYIRDKSLIDGKF